MEQKVKKLMNSRAAAPKTGGKPRFNYLGLLLCIATNVCLAIITLIVKVLTVPSTQKNFARAVVQYMVLLPLVSYSEFKNQDEFFGPPKMLKLMIVRSIIGNVSSICVYYSVTKIPVGDAVSLTFFSTVLTGIIGYFTLGESLSWVDGACAVMSTAGVILISKPHFIFGDVVAHIKIEPDDHRIGVITGLAGALLIATTITLARKISHVSAGLITFYFSFWGVLITSSFSLIVYGGYTVPCISEIPLVIAHGLIGLLSQICMAYALRYERAVVFAVCRSLQIVIVFVFQVVILKDTTNWLSVSGASLIVVSAAAVALNKFYRGTDENEPTLVISDDVLVAT